MVERTDVQTFIFVCRSSGRPSRSSLKVKVIGQRSRSPGQKCFFSMRWGVFNAYVVSLTIFTDIVENSHLEDREYDHIKDEEWSWEQKECPDIRSPSIHKDVSVMCTFCMSRCRNSTLVSAPTNHRLRSRKGIHLFWYM